MEIDSFPDLEGAPDVHTGEENPGVRYNVAEGVAVKAHRVRSFYHSSQVLTGEAMAARSLDNLDAHRRRLCEPGTLHLRRPPQADRTMRPRRHVKICKRFVIPRDSDLLSGLVQNRSSLRMDGCIASRGIPTVMRVTTLKAGEAGLAVLIDYYAGLAAD